MTERGWKYLNTSDFYQIHRFLPWEIGTIFNTRFATQKATSRGIIYDSDQSCHSISRISQCLIHQRLQEILHKCLHWGKEQGSNWSANTLVLRHTRAYSIDIYSYSVQSNSIQFKFPNLRRIINCKIIFSKGQILLI